MYCFNGALRLAEKGQGGRSFLYLFLLLFCFSYYWNKRRIEGKKYAGEKSITDAMGGADIIMHTDDRKLLLLRQSSSIEIAIATTL